VRIPALAKKGRRSRLSRAGLAGVTPPRRGAPRCAAMAAVRALMATLSPGRGRETGRSGSAGRGDPGDRADRGDPPAKPKAGRTQPERGRRMGADCTPPPRRETVPRDRHRDAPPATHQAIRRQHGKRGKGAKGALRDWTPPSNRDTTGVTVTPPRCVPVPLSEGRAEPGGGGGDTLAPECGHRIWR
jgi:hypothetical protein